MKIQDIKEFLKSFGLEEESIEELTSQKHLTTTTEGIFLVDEEFSEEEVYKEHMIFIHLSKTLPTKFLLEFIREKSQVTLPVKTTKQALNFTYGKDLSMDMVDTESPLKENTNYIVENFGRVLGYVTYDKNQNFCFRNQMHIGEYLKEN